MRWLIGLGFVLLVVSLTVVPVAALGDDGILGVTLATENDAVVVCRVLDGGPGDKAGLLVGDRLLKINGEAVSDVRWARRSLQHAAPGAHVVIQIRRGSTTKQVDVRMTSLDELRPLLVRRRARIPSRASVWCADSWDLPRDVQRPPSHDNTKGKVVVFHAFQSW